MPRLGLHSHAFTPLWIPAEAGALLPKFREHGVSAVEIPLLDPRTFDHAGTRAVAERESVEILCSIELPAELDVTARTADAVDYLILALDVARKAGSECLTGVTYATVGKITNAHPTDTERDTICRLVDTVSQRARALNMRLGLEPINRYETHLLNTARHAVEIIERVGSENVFVHLDTFHMNLEEAGMGAGFADAAEHLGYVQLSESNRGVPGRGSIDWDKTFEGLRDVDFDGILTLESPAYLVPSVAARLSIWRPVADNPNDVIDVGLPLLREKARSAGMTFSG